MQGSFNLKSLRREISNAHHKISNSDTLEDVISFTLYFGIQGKRSSSFDPITLRFYIKIQKRGVRAGRVWTGLVWMCWLENHARWVRVALWLTFFYGWKNYFLKLKRSFQNCVNKVQNTKRCAAYNFETLKINSVQHILYCKLALFFYHWCS